MLGFPMGSSVCLPGSGLVVPILVATHEIHYGTYVASYVEGHKNPESPLLNEILLFLEDPVCHTKHLREIEQGF